MTACVGAEIGAVMTVGVGAEIGTVMAVGVGAEVGTDAGAATGSGREVGVAELMQPTSAKIVRVPSKSDTTRTEGLLSPVNTKNEARNWVVPARGFSGNVLITPPGGRQDHGRGERAEPLCRTAPTAP